MNARLSLVLLSLAAFGGLSPAARAQSWSFSIGTGHHHGGYHHHYYDPFWCGPHYDYIYVAPPPPVIRREIRYVEPVETTTVETRVLPPRVSNTSPAAKSASASSTTDAPLQIWNSAGRRASVAFLVDGQEVALADGQSHTFYGGGSRSVEYDRGGNFGTGRAVLTEGQYEFVVTSRGWDLVRRGVGGRSVATRTTTPKNELPAGELPGEAVRR